MNVSNLLSAIGLPNSTSVNQRVPKKIFIENGAKTTADKRQINEGIEEIYWLATIKPSTVGVPEYRDEMREYLEIAILNVTLRSGANARRIAELVHRAIPYPVWLLLVQERDIKISLAHKRWAQNEKSKVVLEGEIVEIDLGSHSKATMEIEKRFLDGLSLSNQRRSNLMVLYQNWIDSLVAWQAALLTGEFTQATTTERAIIRRESLVQYIQLTHHIETLRSQAIREQQVSRLVEINMEIKRLEIKLDVVKANI
ncbi:DUF4391 domain-containing protein [Paenibacillus oceani]|uniref:DUF4391 domain-containing protein n=1 Tax=Paenibacillus oceani TaxID=2772510 RepID=A0A927H0H5_9BACL|nr:DUF4391 domain-containing protein [Paenibacillus oceani]MBD2862489.1 DUF4391 domain-containing protein [Paenibacillus oceani]